MYETRTIAGHECNCTMSKSGELRLVAVMVGSAEEGGWRAKDGRDARKRRNEVRAAVMQATGLSAGKVRIVSRFTSLGVDGHGNVVKRDEHGRVIGVFGS